MWKDFSQLYCLMETVIKSDRIPENSSAYYAVSARDAITSCRNMYSQHEASIHSHGALPNHGSQGYIQKYFS